MLSREAPKQALAQDTSVQAEADRNRRKVPDFVSRLFGMLQRERRSLEAGTGMGLAICRGIQVLNVALGGTLYQDIETLHPGARVHRDWEIYDAHAHEISVVSRLRPLICTSPPTIRPGSRWTCRRRRRFRKRCRRR